MEGGQVYKRQDTSLYFLEDIIAPETKGHFSLAGLSRPCTRRIRTQVWLLLRVCEWWVRIPSFAEFSHRVCFSLETAEAGGT